MTPGHVGVGEPTAQTKQIDNVELTQPLPSGQLVQRQLIGLGDPDDWSKVAEVTATEPAAGALGLVVRPVGGTGIPATNYDSGLLPVPDVPTVVTAITTQVRTLLLINDSTQLRHFTLQDGDANVYVSDLPVAAKSVQALDFGGAALSNGIGIKCKAGQTSLRVQFVGRQ